MHGGSNRAEGWAFQAALAGTRRGPSPGTTAVAEHRSGPCPAAARAHRGRADRHGPPGPHGCRSTGSHGIRRRFLRSVTVCREVRLGAARLHPVRLPVDGLGRAPVAEGATEPASLRAARMRARLGAGASASSPRRGCSASDGPARRARRRVGGKCFPLRAGALGAKLSAGPVSFRSTFPSGPAILTAIPSPDGSGAARRVACPSCPVKQHPTPPSGSPAARASR